MQRKIIKLGQATFVLSLPSKWIRKYDLKQGNYLEVDEKDNTLLVSTEKQLGYKSITIELPKKELFLKRLVFVPYRFGYDEIKFVYKDPTLIKEIQKAAKFLMGFEIVDQGEKYCVFRNISSSFEDEFENIFKRVFLVIINLMQDSLQIIENKEFQRFENLIETETIIDKLTCFCERVINKRGSQDFMKNSLSYITIWTLERMGDDLKLMFKYMSHFTETTPELKNFFVTTKEFFQLYFTNYYKTPDVADNLKFKRKYEELQHQGELLMEKAKKKETKVIHHLLNIVEKINSIALSIQVSQVDQKMIQ